MAGRTASKVVSWVVPQIMEAWDNDRTDVDRLLNRIIHGVMHHPAQRDQGEDGARDGRSIMFRSVEEWWNQKDSREKDDYRRKLSRDGVERGENHKEGVHDTGHGCGKPLGMHKQFGGSGGGNTMEDQIATAAAGAIIGGVTSGISGVFEDQTGYKLPTQNQQGSGPWASGDSSQQERPSSGGGIGGLIGGLLSGFKSEEKTGYQSSGRTDDGGYQQTTTEYGRHGDRYGQAEEKVTEYPSGGRRTEYSQFEQQEEGGRHGGRRHEQGSGYVEETETQPVYGGGYQQHTERKWEDNRGEYRREEETSTFGGGSGFGGGFGGGRRDEYDGGRQQEEYGGGRREEYGGGRQEEYGSGRREEGGGWGGERREEYGGRREEGGGWGGERREEYGERREEGGGGFGGGMFGGGGESILENLAEQAADTFTQDDENTGRDTTGDDEWRGEERREEYGEDRRGGGWGF